MRSLGRFGWAVKPLAGAAALALALGACGGDDNATLQDRDTPTDAIDDADNNPDDETTAPEEAEATQSEPGQEPTDQAGRDADATESDDDGGFVLDIPQEAIDAATNEADAAGSADDETGDDQNADAAADPEQGEAETEPDPAPTAHPLEEVVIDDTPDNEDAEFVWDEAAALACAHTEFALDALISDDADALNDTLTTAADYADQSQNAGLSTFADQLATTRDDGTEDLVVDVLTACTEAGYEL